MAPEQFVTGRSSVQSDVFALGLILYELASGRHPFHRPDAPEFQTIRATQFADPPNLREIVPDLPVELESVILRCLEKQPSARFASAADVREGLRTVMKALQLDSVGMPGDSISQLPAQGRLELEIARGREARHRHPLHARRAFPRVRQHRYIQTELHRRPALRQLRRLNGTGS